MASTITLTEALKLQQSIETSNFKIINHGSGLYGIAVRMKNGTGSASVLGSLVSVSQAADNVFILQNNEYDSIGVVAESGVANGEECYVIISGVARVLFKDGESSTRGNILLAADTDGRGYNVANPGGGLPGTDAHFKECGHVLQSVSSGTNILVYCVLHFN